MEGRFEKLKRLSFLADQDIPSLLEDPKFHFTVHKNYYFISKTVSSVQPKCFHLTHLHIYKYYSTTYSQVSKMFWTFEVVRLTFLKYWIFDYRFYLIRIRATCSVHLILLKDDNNVNWRAQITKGIMCLSTLLC